MDLRFILHSVLFGIGLDMDAFCVFLAQRSSEQGKPLYRECGITGPLDCFRRAYCCLSKKMVPDGVPE